MVFSWLQFHTAPSLCSHYHLILENCKQDRPHQIQVFLEEVAKVEGSDCGCDTISQSFPLPLFPLVPLPSLLRPLWPLQLPLPRPLPLTLILLSLEVSLEEIAVTEGSDWASRRIIFIIQAPLTCFYLLHVEKYKIGYPSSSRSSPSSLLLGQANTQNVSLRVP